MSITILITQTNNQYQFSAYQESQANQSQRIWLEKECDVVVCELTTVSNYFIRKSVMFALDTLTKDSQFNFKVSSGTTNKVMGELFDFVYSKSEEFLSIKLN